MLVGMGVRFIYTTANYTKTTLSVNSETETGPKHEYAATTLNEHFKLGQTSQIVGGLWKNGESFSSFFDSELYIYCFNMKHYTSIGKICFCIGEPCISVWTDTMH